MKLASCLAAALAASVSSAGGAVVGGRRETRVLLRPGRAALVRAFATGFGRSIAATVEPRGGLLAPDHGRVVIHRITRR